MGPGKGAACSYQYLHCYQEILNKLLACALFQIQTSLHCRSCAFGRAFCERERSGLTCIYLLLDQLAFSLYLHTYYVPIYTNLDTYLPFCLPTLYLPDLSSYLPATCWFWKVMLNQFLLLELAIPKILSSTCHFQTKSYLIFNLPWLTSPQLLCPLGK